MNSSRIAGAVVVLAVVIAVGSGIALLNNGIVQVDTSDSQGAYDIPTGDEGSVGESFLQSTPDYVKWMAAGAVILGAFLIIRRELS
jgi:hypothetical protein